MFWIHKILNYLFSNSWVRPLEANGTGSTFLRINRSAKEAKHFKAPSATTWSSPLDKRLLKHSTHSPRLSSWGSILVHNLDTTDMAEWRVSLWMRLPLSLMNPRTQVRPPASKTAPASRVQMSSNTLIHCSAKSFAVRDSVKSAMTNLWTKRGC